MNALFNREIRENRYEIDALCHLTELAKSCAISSVTSLARFAYLAYLLHKKTESQQTSSWLLSFANHPYALRVFKIAVNAGGLLITRLCNGSYLATMRGNGTMSNGSKRVISPIIDPSSELASRGVPCSGMTAKKSVI